MKKVISFVALATLLAAGSAFATDINFTTTAGKNVTAQDGKVIGKLSANVGLGAALDSTNGTAYAIATANSKGTKSFGTSYDSTAIYSVDGITGTSPSASDSSAFSSWTAM